MSQRFIDDNSIQDVIDDNGITDFVDDNGNFTLSGGGGFNAIDLIDSSPTIGTATLIVIIGNVVIFSDRVLDFGVTIFASETNALFLCSSDPTTYVNALSLQLATKAGTIFNAVTAATLGRKVVSNAITDGSCVADGTVTHWAAVDTTNSRLLAHGPVVTPHTVLSGQKFTMPSFSLEFDRG